VSQRAAGWAVDDLRLAEPDLRARRGEGVCEVVYTLILPELGRMADALGPAGVAGVASQMARILLLIGVDLLAMRSLRGCIPPVT
jgi:uncharacterized membrane protein YtjA (UPF0391 family)